VWKSTNLRHCIGPPFFLAWPPHKCLKIVAIPRCRLAIDLSDCGGKRSDIETALNSIIHQYCMAFWKSDFSLYPSCWTGEIIFAPSSFSWECCSSWWVDLTRPWHIVTPNFSLIHNCYLNSSMWLAKNHISVSLKTAARVFLVWVYF